LLVKPLYLVAAIDQQGIAFDRVPRACWFPWSVSSETGISIQTRVLIGHTLPLRAASGGPLVPPAVVTRGAG
jgi:hypothetical protein